MEKPIKPWPPNDITLKYYLMEDRYEDVSIYWYRDLIHEDYDEESFAEECLEANYTPPEKDISEISLADIIRLIPPGIDHSQIRLRTSWPRYMEWIDYQYVYSRPIDKASKQAEYDLAMKQYKIAEATYNKEMVEYEKYSKQAEIDALEEKLAKLKK